MTYEWYTYYMIKLADEIVIGDWVKYRTGTHYTRLGAFESVVRVRDVGNGTRELIFKGNRKMVVFNKQEIEYENKDIDVATIEGNSNN